MKKIIAITLISSMSFVSAMQNKLITFSSAQKIEAQLAANKIPPHISNRMQIPAKLGDKEMNLSEVVPHLHNIYAEYIGDIQNDEPRKQRVTEHLTKEQPRLLAALFSHDRQAIEYFTENGFIKSEQ